MAGPLPKTFEVLTDSNAPEAVELLLAALESTYESLSLAAAQALLARNGVQGQREILLRFPTLPESVQQALQAQPERFESLLRQLLVQGGSEQLLEGLNGVRLLHAADQIPQLIQLLCHADLQETDAVVQCLHDLVVFLDDDVRTTSVTDAARNAVLGRRDRALNYLDQAVSTKYESLVVRDPIVESILILGPAQHLAVKKVLWQAATDCRDRAGKMLLTNRHPKVMRQALESLKQSYPHPKAFEAVCVRTDVEFICELLRAASGKSTPAFEQNLKQIERLAWLDNLDATFKAIPTALQPALLSFVFSTKVSPEHKGLTQDWLLRNGGPEGRMAAAEKAALLDENVIQGVLVDSLDADDEHVQAWAVTQLRQHAVPEAFALLLERLESPSAEVRAAVCQELSDFNLDRVLGLVDAFDRSTAHRVGQLLRKIDVHAGDKLQRELRQAIRPKRVRAAKAVVKLGFDRILLPELLDLANDGDVIIRRTIAEELGWVTEPDVLPVLERLAHDSHPRVRDAAVRAIAHWQKLSTDHLDSLLVT